MNPTTASLPVLAVGSHVLDESNARLTLEGVPLEIPPKAPSGSRFISASNRCSAFIGPFTRKRLIQRLNSLTEMADSSRQ